MQRRRRARSPSLPPPSAPSGLGSLSFPSPDPLEPRPTSISDTRSLLPLPFPPPPSMHVCPLRHHIFPFRHRDLSYRLAEFPLSDCPNRTFSIHPSSFSPLDFFFDIVTYPDSHGSFRPRNPLIYFAHFFTGVALMHVISLLHHCRGFP